MLQAGGDLGLEEKAAAAIQVVGETILEAFDGNGAVQDRIGAAKDLAQAAPSVSGEVDVRADAGRYARESARQTGGWSVLGAFWEV
jgi:hypothetical protein